MSIKKSSVLVFPCVQDRGLFQRESFLDKVPSFISALNVILCSFYRRLHFVYVSHCVRSNFYLFFSLLCIFVQKQKHGKCAHTCHVFFFAMTLVTYSCFLLLFLPLALAVAPFSFYFPLLMPRHDAFLNQSFSLTSPTIVTENFIKAVWLIIFAFVAIRPSSFLSSLMPQSRWPTDGNGTLRTRRALLFLR